MIRAELIRLLEEGIEIENEAIDLYANHLENKLFLSDFEPSKAIKIREILDHLKKDSQRHKDTLEGLRDSIASSRRDVY